MAKASRYQMGTENIRRSSRTAVLLNVLQKGGTMNGVKQGQDGKKIPIINVSTRWNVQVLWKGGSHDKRMSKQNE